MAKATPGKDPKQKEGKYLPIQTDQHKNATSYKALVSHIQNPGHLGLMFWPTAQHLEI